jgi:hypothetical protein
MRRPLELAFLAFTCCVAVASGACGGKIAPSDESVARTEFPSPASSVTSSPDPLPPTSGSGTLPPSTPSSATYTAYAWAGGLDHVEIFKTDVAANTCVQLHLTSPQKPSPSGAFSSLKTPDTWVVANADRTNDASSCKPGGRRDGLPAVDGKGVISWSGELHVLPCTLNVHAALVFEKLQIAEQLDADAVPVQGCM